LRNYRSISITLEGRPVTSRMITDVNSYQQFLLILCQLVRISSTKHNGQLLRNFHKNVAQAASLSRNGKLAACPTWDKAKFLPSTRSSAELRKLTTDNPPNSPWRFSNDSLHFGSTLRESFPC
jgi:hypothetical protein